MFDKYKFKYGVRIRTDGSIDIEKIGTADTVDKKIAKALNCAESDLLAIPVDVFTFEFTAFMLCDIFACERGKSENKLANLLNAYSDETIFGDVIVIPGKRDTNGYLDIAPAPKEVAQIMRLSLLAWNEVMR